MNYSWDLDWDWSLRRKADNGGGVDPNAWQDDLGNAMTDDLSNPIIFTPEH